jgi:hypothetical protein
LLPQLNSRSEPPFSSSRSRASAIVIQIHFNRD